MSIAAFNQVAEESLWYYLSIYAISNIALFVVLHILEEKYSIFDIEGLEGFFKSDRSMSFLVVILLASFVGLPPLAGFIAKFYVFSATFEHYIQSANTSVLLLLIAAALNTVISLFYYFNIARSIFLKDTSAQWEPRGEALQGFNTERIVVYVLVFALIIFGIFPNLLIGLF
jgi:NADH-quinone oxidoreductase subunit N